MTILAQEGFENGTLGAAVQEAETIFSNVDNTGITYVAGLDGSSLACNFNTSGSAAVRNSAFTAMDKIVTRFIFKVPSNLPSSSCVIADLCLGDPAAGGLRIAQIQLQADGTLRLRNVFTAVATSVMTVSVNTEYALEWYFDGATQQQTLRIFTNVSTVATPAETLGPVSAAGSGATQADWVQVGKMTGIVWTGGFTIDKYRRADTWVATAAANVLQWNLEWVGTDGNDISLPAGWTKEGPNTNSPKYGTGGPHTDQSVLVFSGQQIGNRNLLSPQLPAGVDTYERFYFMSTIKVGSALQEECIWSAGSAAGITLFRLVMVPGINDLFDLELWADNDWDPTAVDPVEGQPPLPQPLGVITGFSLNSYHRIEIHVDASTGPATCTVQAWKGPSRNSTGNPDGVMSGDCVGTTSLRYRRFGQMLHPNVSATEPHRNVSFDSMVASQDGTPIGPLSEADQYDPPLNTQWAFFEWDGANEIPLGLAGASTGGASLEEVNIGDTVTTPPDPSGKLFTNDPGLGKKLYIGTDRIGGNEYDTAADLFNFEMRTLSAGPNHPASDRCAMGYYRMFSPTPTPSLGWGTHSGSSWGIRRKVAANCAISESSFNTGYGGSFTKQTGADDMIKWWDGSRNNWLKNELAPMLIEAYERYGHLTMFDFGNEADRGDRTTAGLNPLWVSRVKRAVRYVHFYLIDVCDVPKEAFMVTTATMVQMSAYDHGDEGGKRHYKPIETEALSWPSGVRADALYYWCPDWKETRTVADGYWSDPYDPNPVDFIQPGEMDQWNYGRGPVQRHISMNFYERDYEYANIETYNEFYNKVVSLTGGYPRTGNMWKFDKALHGGADPVLPVETANRNGVPVFVGEMGIGVWVPLPSSENAAEPAMTADAYCESIIPDMVEKCNIAGYAKWRYVLNGYDAFTNTDTDTYSHHYKVGSGAGAGTRLWDPTNANTKAEASLFNTDYVAVPPPWPDGTPRPPNVWINGGAKRDYRGINDVP